jgi:hypothetical protein
MTTVTRANLARAHHEARGDGDGTPERGHGCQTRRPALPRTRGRGARLTSRRRARSAFKAPRSRSRRHRHRHRRRMCSSSLLRRAEAHCTEAQHVCVCVCVFVDPAPPRSDSSSVGTRTGFAGGVPGGRVWLNVRAQARERVQVRTASAGIRRASTWARDADPGGRMQLRKGRARGTRTFLFALVRRFDRVRVALHAYPPHQPKLSRAHVCVNQMV